MDALKGEKRKADVLKRKEWVTAQKKLNKQLRQAQRESERSDIHLKKSLPWRLDSEGTDDDGEPRLEEMTRVEPEGHK